MIFRSQLPAPTERQFQAALDQFAEHLSNDTPLNDIAELMGTTRGSVCVYLHALNLKYGWQAA